MGAPETKLPRTGGSRRACDVIKAATAVPFFLSSWALQALLEAEGRAPEAGLATGTSVVTVFWGT